MNIYSSDKIEIEYDSYNKEFTISVYDTYGHYIDSTKVDKDDMKELYRSLDEVKDLFQANNLLFLKNIYIFAEKYKDDSNTSIFIVLKEKLHS